MIGLVHLDRAHPSVSANCKSRGHQLIGLLRVVMPLLIRVTPEDVELLLAAAAQMKARYAIWRTANTIRVHL